MGHSPYQTLEYAITCIDTGYQRPDLAACYMIEAQGELAFVDTGTTYTLPVILKLLEARGLTTDQVKYIIVTHVHLDHAGGAGALMEKCPEAQLVVHPFGTRHMVDPTKLTAGATAVYGEEQFRKAFGRLIPIPRERVIEASDEIMIELGGRSLLCLDTPGHARHHICIYDDRSKGLFTGDTFGLSYRDLDTSKGAFILPTTTPVQFDPPAWQATLSRLMEINPSSAYLTHYGKVNDMNRLADDLHQAIDSFAEIALTVEAENRIAGIQEKLWAWTYNALMKHGCSLGEPRLKALLAMDIELNAQGLDVWLQRREREQAGQPR
ncbi:MAG: beta-lactamase [Gammaproteobacteria bacterium (ex Lamellibrachia satsuma)]|nr:MAG: MBL fold metallo-hydrolase [Gammaproteobacteria bacterium (ex Lamellibrachia satsuma)]RRS31063.1 MAG: beta-lactamase [Gammaproteobacteria bacterium (ex Lamellibrachia satsuma)]RRS34151.1 MAG: beta-lactamase [Gammaproteobacteria bacterium (ex Lamellibrachia satsuma)]